MTKPKKTIYNVIKYGLKEGQGIEWIEENIEEITSDKYRNKIKQLERRIEELEKQRPMLPSYPISPIKQMFESECLHNGCRHDKNPVCMLYCPHCSPMC